MNSELNTKMNWTKLVIVFLLMSCFFSFSAMAQSDSKQPLDAEAATALVSQLKEELSDLIEDEEQTTAVSEKWDAREDLADKTKAQILNLLFADVKSIVTDKKTQDVIWKAWNEDGAEQSESVKRPDMPVPVKASRTASGGGNEQRSESMRGKIKFFNDARGVGVITTASGEDAFFHISDFQSSGAPSLTAGVRVTFLLTSGPKGLQAKDVRVE